MTPCGAIDGSVNNKKKPVVAHRRTKYKQSEKKLMIEFQLKLNLYFTH